MKVLFVGMRWDYKDPRRGDSFEYTNFFHSMRMMRDVEVEPFFFDEVERLHGTRTMNRSLLETVQETSPDLVFFFLYEDEFDVRTVDEITKRVPTFNWFADDHWRYDIFSIRWAPHFTLVGTTDDAAVERYHQARIGNVIKTQWACNHHVFRPLEVERDLDVTFVGQAHGDRREKIDDLRRAGVRVETWGTGWESGRISLDEMVRMFARSKVNLNFAAGSFPRRFLEKLYFLARGSRPLSSPTQLRRRFEAMRARRQPQIKGRTFEIPGCGSLLLTETVPGLENYYIAGREIVTFENPAQLRDQCLHYMEHSEEAEVIARAGLERTVADHTYERRFDEIFSALGIGRWHPSADAGGRNGPSG